MADLGERAAKQLREITECSICMSAFTDPRMLPCIHTFCFDCIKRTSEEAQTKPGDKMPCPLCRKEFIIPADGMNGVHKNFFMKNFLDFKTTLEMGSATIICDMCNVRNTSKTGQLPTATMRCLQCLDNLCHSCVKVHQLQNLKRNHQLVKIRSDTTSGIDRVSSVKFCSKHTQKPLDYYCADCKKIVCVSCFVESHKFHDCKDVTTVDKEFRQTIEKNAWKISNYADEIMSVRKNTEMRKATFLKKMVEIRNAIRERNQQLKDIVDRDTISLLDELSAIKYNRLKEIETEMDEIDRSSTILKSFEAYCTELRLKGSASDICSSVDQLIGRADELEKDHEAFIGRPHLSVEVSVHASDLREVLQKSTNNFVGQITAERETMVHFESNAIVVGLDDGKTIAKDVVEINLHQPNEITTEVQIPTEMTFQAVAAVYCNTMYVTGMRSNADEIWKYKQVYGWKKCGYLVQGRRRHCAAFIDEILYICGGFVKSTGSVLDSVEAYNAVTNKCTAVGKLVHCVQSSGNCVPFRSSIYIFGGMLKEGSQLSHVQLYNTRDNTSTVISKPMPRPYCLMRAVIWETSVVLLGWETCFIFNFETETWQERRQFKTDVNHFALVLENKRVFVIGGGMIETDKDGKDIWTCRDDVRYVPLQNIVDDNTVEWKIHASLPQPCLIHAYDKLTFFVI